MPQTKTFQHLRNSTVYNNLAAAQSALQDSTFMSNRSDGEMIFARYNKTEGNATVVKTLAGLYHKNGNNVSCTFLMEVNPDDDHLTVSYDDMTYWNSKMDELISGVDIKTINNTSLLGSGNISIDVNKIIPGEYNSTQGIFYRGTIIRNQWAFEQIPGTYYSDKLYVDVSDKKIYWYDETSGTFTEAGGVSITIDSVITSGGTNPVQGGAIYTALSNKEDKVTVVTVSTSGAVSQALDPNKFYKFTGDLTSLSLTFNSGTELAVYAGKFNTDSTGFTLTVPGTIHEAVGNPTPEGGKTYEFNVADNVLIMIEV